MTWVDAKSRPFHKAVCNAGSCGKLQRSNEAALEGMPHCLKSIMRPQFLIDVVKMVTKRLRGDTKCLGNSWGCSTHRKHPENFKFLRG